jgi:hypothetical protein
LLLEQLTVVDAAIAAAVERQPVENVSAETLDQRRADALVTICESYLTDHRPKSRPACQRQQVVLHVDGDVVAGRSPAPVEGSGVALHPATAKRLGCDAEVLVLFEEGGKTIGAGHVSRSINRKLRRALMRRSKGVCEWPGCDQRVYLEGHHIWHWEDGGPTELWNLANLCWWHHHAVHEGGFAVRLDDTTVHAYRPDGTEIGAAPRVEANGRIEADVDADAIVARWAGERLELDLAVDALISAGCGATVT